MYNDPSSDPGSIISLSLNFSIWLLENKKGQETILSPSEQNLVVCGDLQIVFTKCANFLVL